jgi:hypothetical protein
MADYTLTDGKATLVRESVGDAEGYVDLDINGCTEETAPVGTDHLVLQRGAADPKKVLLSNVRGVYDTLWVPAASMAPSKTDGASAETVEFATNGITHDVLVFAGIGGDTHAEFDVAMPDQWDRGTIKAKVFWSNGGADVAASEYVEFYLAAGARSNDDALDAVLGSAVDIADQLIADGDLHVTAATPAITVGGTPALGDLVHFKLSRDYDHAGGGAAMDENAYVFGVLLQYAKTADVVAW